MSLLEDYMASDDNLDSLGFMFGADEDLSDEVLGDELAERAVDEIVEDAGEEIDEAIVDMAQEQALAPGANALETELMPTVLERQDYPLAGVIYAADDKYEKGDFVKPMRGLKRKKSVWSGGFGKGKSYEIIDFDEIDDERVLVLSTGAGRDNYQVVYFDEVKSGKKEYGVDGKPESGLFEDDNLEGDYHPWETKLDAHYGAKSERKFEGETEKRREIAIRMIPILQKKLEDARKAHCGIKQAWSKAEVDRLEFEIEDFFEDFPELRYGSGIKSGGLEGFTVEGESLSDLPKKRVHGLGHRKKNRGMTRWTWRVGAPGEDPLDLNDIDEEYSSTDLKSGVEKNVEFLLKKDRRLIPDKREYSIIVPDGGYTYDKNIFEGNVQVSKGKKVVSSGTVVGYLDFDGKKYTLTGISLDMALKDKYAASNNESPEELGYLAGRQVVERGESDYIDKGKEVAYDVAEMRGMAKEVGVTGANLKKFEKGFKDGLQSAFMTMESKWSRFGSGKKFIHINDLTEEEAEMIASEASGTWGEPGNTVVREGVTYYVIDDDNDAREVAYGSENMKMENYPPPLGEISEDIDNENLDVVFNKEGEIWNKLPNWEDSISDDEMQLAKVEGDEQTVNIDDEIAGGGTGEEYASEGSNWSTYVFLGGLGVLLLALSLKKRG